MPDALDWLRQALGGPATPEAAPGASWEAMQQGVAGTPTPPYPSAFEALKRRLSQTVADTQRAGSVIGNYLAEAPGKAIDYAGNQVAAPFLQGQADLMARDWSQVPLVDKEGGRIGALGSYVAPYLYGGAPAGATSAGIRAYHASPFDFNEFTLNNLRGGTGGLAQGRGLYFAQKEPVSLDYKRLFQERGAAWVPPSDRPWAGLTAVNPFDDVMLATERALEAAPKPPKWAADLGWRGDVPSPHDVTQNVIAGLQKGDDLAAYRQFVQESGWSPVKKSLYLAAIDAAEPWKYKPGPAHMYEVDIHADPNRLLDWDKPLVAQADPVKQSLSQIGVNLRPDLPETLTRSGEDIYRWLAARLQSEYPGATKGYMPPPGFDAEALLSQQMQEAGIPGIKYLDQFSRNLPDAAARTRMQERVASLERSLDPANPYSNPMTIGEIERLKRELAVQPTHNYVISDPQRTRIEILRKYGLLPPLAVGAGGGLLGEE